MSLIKQLIPQLQLKFTPSSSEVNWTRVETLVHGPGAGEDPRSVNSAVFSCLMAIATAYPEPPLCVYRQKKDGNDEKLPDHPMQALLDYPTPNGELSIDEIQFWTAWALHIDGNAYWLKVRSGNNETGNVIQLWPVSPLLMEPVSQGGEWISFYKYRVASDQVIGVPPGNVVHFRLGLDDHDMRKGLAPLKHLARQVSTDDEADKFVDALLKNFAVPGLVVIPQNGMTVADENEAERLESKFSRKFTNDKRGKVAIMSKEVKVEQFGFSPKDLDMSILHRIPEERISGVMGVPAIVAGLGAGLDRATYDNADALIEFFTERKLVPLWRVNARKLNMSLRPDFTPDKNIYIKYDMTDVRALQEDEDAKYERLSVALGKQPWITRNEARVDIGLDPRDEWDDTQKPAPPAPSQPGQQQPAQGAPGGNGKQPVQEEQSAKMIDLEKWQRRAIKDVKAKQPVYTGFVSEHISDDEHIAIAEALSKVESIEDVKAVFDVHIQAAQPWSVIERLVFEMDRANSLLEKTNV